MLNKLNEQREIPLFVIVLENCQMRKAIFTADQNIAVN